MFKRIVVGVDGGAEGRDAIALATAIAQAADSAVTLLAALPSDFLSGDAGVARSERIAAAERRLLDDTASLARSAQIEIVVDADPARALSAAARRRHADLVVIGSSRRAAVGRCSIGHTGRRLLEHVPAAIAIARRGLREREPSLESIAVGYDGGPESEIALQLADGLAGAAAAELEIETIYEEPIATLALGDRSPRRIVDELRADQRRGALVVAERAAERVTPRTRLRVCVGAPGVELRRASEEVDLLVIGSRRWGPFARIVLGSAGETLVSDCGSSLMVARKGPRRASAPGTDGYKASMVEAG